MIVSIDVDVPPIVTVVGATVVAKVAVDVAVFVNVSVEVAVKVASRSLGKHHSSDSSPTCANAVWSQGGVTQYKDRTVILAAKTPFQLRKN